MAAPKDPTKILTEQEQISQSLVNNLPFVIAFFSLNVPSGLAVYWIINNILTTAVTLVVKRQFKDDVMPPEVAQMMAEVDAPVVSRTRKTSSGQSEMRKMSSAAIMGEEKKEVGFSSTSAIIDTTAVEGGEVSQESVEMNAEKEEAQAADDEKKRKKRAASRAKGKKRA
jgi:YidC/Oxa1 family membrane protein insertase